MSRKDSSNPQFLSVNEAAFRLGVRHQLVRRLYRRGELRGFRVGSHIRIYADSVEEYIRKNSNWPQYEKGENLPTAIPTPGDAPGG